MSDRLRTAVIVLVAIVWAANFTAPIFVRDYKPAPELNVAFMAIIGVLTASYNKKGQQGTNGKDEGTQEEKNEEAK